LSQHTKALEDADYVIKNLDPLNVKALSRRATASKFLGRIEDAIRDFQALLKANPQGEKETRKELDELMKKLVENQRQKKQAAAS
jgi:cytochrome c-type biogenesis protein CcmH/NrfG